MPRPQDLPKFNRNIYLALAAIAWADGELDQEEADAMVRAAIEQGMELEEIEAIEHATRYRVALDDVNLNGLAPAERTFLYAIAAWMTRLDGAVSWDETAALKELASRLWLAPETQRQVHELTEDIAKLTGDERPARYDLPALQRAIVDRFGDAFGALAPDSQPG